MLCRKFSFGEERIIMKLSAVSLHLSHQILFLFTFHITRASLNLLQVVLLNEMLLNFLQYNIFFLLRKGQWSSHFQSDLLSCLLFFLKMILCCFKHVTQLEKLDILSYISCNVYCIILESCNIINLKSCSSILKSRLVTEKVL